MNPPYPSSPPSTSARAFNGNVRPFSTYSSKLPSANGRPLPDMNGYSSKLPSSGDNGSSPSKPFSHISDLQANAVKGLSVDHSLNFLVNEAQRALSSADSLLDFRRPDLAYQDYLRAFEIVVNIIPRHADHPSLTGKRGPVEQTHKDLITVHHTSSIRN